MENKEKPVENSDGQEPGKSGKTSILSRVPENVARGGDTLKRFIPEPPTGIPLDNEPPDYTSARLQQLLGGKYRFEKLLGRGGFALVYKVTNLNLNRVEALKVLTNLQSDQPDSTGRFIEEARVSASLIHPHIVQVYEFGHLREFFWFSMQYIQGPTLAMELKARKKMDQFAAINLILPLLDALAYSHKKGVVHRDMKPGNIMLDLSGRPYLMDFGIAKSMDSQFQTKTGQFLGTPVYISPEQVSGRKVDGRADIFAIGVMLYEMLTGHYPFPSANSVHALVLRMTNDPVPISDNLPGIAPELEDIVMRALEKDPDKRYSSAAELQVGLLNFMGDNQTVQPIEVLSWSPDMADGAPVTEMESDESVPTLKSLKPTRQEPFVAKRSQRWYQLAVAVLLMAVAGLFFIIQKNNGVPDTHNLPKNTAGDLPKAPAPKPPAIANKTNMDTTAATTGPAVEEDVLEDAHAKPKNDLNLPKKTGKSADLATAKKKQNVKNGESTGRDNPYLLGRAVKQPFLEKEVEPVYNPEDTVHCNGLTVNVSMTVGTDGRVIEVKIVSRDHPPECAGALKAVKEAAMQYRFTPALDARGKPLKAKVIMAIRIARSIP